MLAILEIDGWRKEETISDRAYHAGWVEIALFPPIRCLVSPEDTVFSVVLHYVGMVEGIPKYKYIPGT